MNTTTLNGIVIASYGRHQRVESDTGEIYLCVGRSKQTSLACGDRVTFSVTSAKQGVINQSLPRTNLLYRSVAHREKLIAANVDQIIMVVAPKPSYYSLLLNRCLIAAEASRIPVVVCLNKSDLGDTAIALREELNLYENFVQAVISVSALQDVSSLIPLLTNKTSVFIGQSGMGKSSIINALIPDLQLITQEISTALDSGRHTTTGASMYKLKPSGKLIDSAGMQVFGLKHLAIRDLDHQFIEFRHYLGQCRFNNCLHYNEPDCAILAAYEQGVILPARMTAYWDILGELSQK